ncbi:MAG: hypothetical protein ACXW31_09170, partial [Thermoanaerobaculia bacterium]
MDELGEKLQRAADEIRAAIGEQKGAVSFDYQYDDEVTITANRAGFAHLALQALKAAVPPVGAAESVISAADDRLLDSPIAEFKRSDAVAESPRMSWKERFLAGGCVLFALFA